MKQHTKLIILILIAVQLPALMAQQPDSPAIVRGIMLPAPPAGELDRFIDFIGKELAPRKVNTLILRVNFQLEYESRPEIREPNSLSKADAKRLLKACNNKGITIVPLVNCLGHQSWGSSKKSIRALLKAYPEFEENPGDKIHSKNFYCRSYCPLHPQVHRVLFDLLAETVEMFEAKEFHVGMDEVFVLGEDECPRCKGHDKARLFADEVNKLNAFFAKKDVKMWMWGDRLLDGKITGLGKWQASGNGTHPAIDLIDKNITICDWHYQVAPHTATYFAVKGFPVISCSFHIPSVALQQHREMQELKKTSTPQISQRMKGVMHTFWANSSQLMDAFEGKQVAEKSQQAYQTFLALSMVW